MIVYETENAIYDGSQTTKEKTVNNVTISNNQIANDDKVKNCYFTITAVNGSYEIKTQSGYYIGKSAAENGTDFSQNSCTNTISFSGNNVLITGASGYILQWNGSTGYMRYYAKDKQQQIQLYILVS